MVFMKSLPMIQWLFNLAPLSLCYVQDGLTLSRTSTFLAVAPCFHLSLEVLNVLRLLAASTYYIHRLTLHLYLKLLAPLYILVCWRSGNPHIMLRLFHLTTLYPLLEILGKKWRSWLFLLSNLRFKIFGRNWHSWLILLPNLKFEILGKNWRSRIFLPPNLYLKVFGKNWRYWMYSWVNLWKPGNNI